MKVSKIGLISRKITKIDEQFPVQDMLIQTGQIEQFSSGIYAYGHIPYLVKQNLDNIIRETLNKYGCSELSLPILQPESIWEESGRLEKYTTSEVMFRTKTKLGNFCLAPTAEEAVVAYAKNRLTSHKQLPVTYYQIGQKFRNEIRTRGFLLRGKAFDMMDAYSFGKNKEDLDIEYDNIKKAYLEIFEILGLDVQAVGADSGDMGGAKSEEFMCLSNIGEDNILYDKKTGTAFNSELLEKPNCDEYLKNYYGITDTKSLISRKAVELGHIFQLGDKYSKSMNGKYVDANGLACYYVMGCYGIGVSRTLAMIYENNVLYSNNQFNGVALPLSVAPYQIYIIPKLDDAKKAQLATKIYEELENNGVKVLFDDRESLSVGAKLKDSKITGTPYVAVFGNSIDNGYIEIENNMNNLKKQIALSEFVQECCKLFKNK